MAAALAIEQRRLTAAVLRREDSRRAALLRTADPASERVHRCEPRFLARGGPPQTIRAGPYPRARRCGRRDVERPGCLHLYLWPERHGAGRRRGVSRCVPAASPRLGYFASRPVGAESHSPRDVLSWWIRRPAPAMGRDDDPTIFEAASLKRLSSRLRFPPTEQPHWRKRNPPKLPRLEGRSASDARPMTY